MERDGFAHSAAVALGLALAFGDERMAGVSQHNFRSREKHTCDQKAKGDVIEGVTENVHSAVPAMRKLAWARTTNMTARRDRTPLPATVDGRRTPLVSAD